MPRYNLRVPSPGDFLYGDGDRSIVADTVEDAREFWFDDTDEVEIYWHSYIGRCRIVYARDVENGDAHDEAEAGDTTVEYAADDGRDLRDGEVRVWEPGWRGTWWNIYRLPPEAQDFRAVPVGVKVWHKRHGDGRTVAGPRRITERSWVVDVEFRDGTTLACTPQAVTLMQTRLASGEQWPRTVWEAKFGDEILAHGHDEGALRTLCAARDARLRAEWEVAQFAAFEASLKAVTA